MPKVTERQEASDIEPRMKLVTCDTNPVKISLPMLMDLSIPSVKVSRNGRVILVQRTVGSIYLYFLLYT